MLAAIATLLLAVSATPVPKVTGPIPVTADSYPFMAGNHDTPSIDLSKLEGFTEDPRRLVDELNRILMHGTMSSAMRDSVVEAVTAVPGSNPRLRVQQAVYLICTSSQYQVQR